MKRRIHQLTIATAACLVLALTGTALAAEFATTTAATSWSARSVCCDSGSATPDDVLAAMMEYMKAVSRESREDSRSQNASNNLVAGAELRIGEAEQLVGSIGGDTSTAPAPAPVAEPDPQPDTEPADAQPAAAVEGELADEPAARVPDELAPVDEPAPAAEDLDDLVPDAQP
jgi:hypothetical protein